MIYYTYIYIYIHTDIHINFFWGGEISCPKQQPIMLRSDAFDEGILDLLDAFMELIEGPKTSFFMLWSWQRFLQRCWGMSSHNGQFWLMLMIDGDISLVSFIQVVVLEWFSVSPGPKQILLSGPPGETGRVLKNHEKNPINSADTNGWFYFWL